MVFGLHIFAAVEKKLSGKLFLKRCDFASRGQEHGFAQRSVAFQLRACEGIESHRHGLASADG